MRAAAGYVSASAFRCGRRRLYGSTWTRLYCSFARLGFLGKLAIRFACTMMMRTPQVTRSWGPTCKDGRVHTPSHCATALRVVAYSTWGNTASFTLCSPAGMFCKRSSQRSNFSKSKA